MYIYNLSVAVANKNFSFKKNPEMIDIIKKAITISNTSFSATRYKRTIEFKNIIDEKHVHLSMTSRDQINPTRSLSSLSRAVISLGEENLIQQCISNGCLFKSMIIDVPRQPITIDELDDSFLLKSVVDLLYSNNKVKKQQLKEFMLPYINDEII